MYQLINRVFDYLNTRSPILFQTPNHRSFGNGAEEIFYGLLRAKRERKKVLFLYPRLVLFGKIGFRVVNREQFHLQSEYAMPNENLYGLLGGWLLSLVVFSLRVCNRLRCAYNFRRVLRLIWPGMPVRAAFDYGYIVPQIGKSTLWKPHRVHNFSWKMVETQHWQHQYDTYTPPRLREDKRRYAEQIRLQMGLPPTDWFVCLHVSENVPPMARNASIHNYIEAIGVIMAAGGWVVRLGDPTMTPLPPMERVIDYAHTRSKSALMDMYLISQCRFFIGLTSGPNVVATLFRKPMVLVNMTEWSLGFPLKRGDLALIRHIFSRSRNRFLSIQEILEEPFTVQVYSSPSDEYCIVENTSEEIREVIEEFLTTPKPYAYSHLQETFNEGRRRQIRRWLEQGEPRGWAAVPERDIVIHQYRLAAMVAASGTLGHKYLARNWLVDTLETSALQRAAISQVHGAVTPDGAR